MSSHPVKTAIFYTEEDRNWQDTDQSDILTTRTFQPPYINSPQIFLGLNKMDLAPGARAIGIKSSAEEIEPDDFQPRISIWGDGAMSAAGCTWVETDSSNPRIKTGVCRTSRHSAKSFDVKFDTPFESKPKVLVWLGGFQMDAEYDWDVGGWAENVEEDGFTLNVKTGEDTVLYQSTFSWIAFVEGDEVCGERVCEINIPIDEDESDADKYRYWDEVVDFPTAFEKKPRVALGISRINASGIGIRIGFPAPVVEEGGIKFQVMTWWYTAIEKADVSWVAVAAV